MKELWPYLGTGFLGLLGIIFTYLGMRAKNKADALKSSEEAHGKKEENTDRIIARWERDNRAMEDKLLLKNTVIDGLERRIVQKEQDEKLYINKIEELERKIEKLTSEVRRLSMSIDHDQRPEEL